MSFQVLYIWSMPTPGRPRQLRPSRTEETSVIELKVPSHFGDSVQLGAETADEIDLPRSEASSQYRRAADENV